MAFFNRSRNRPIPGFPLFTPHFSFVISSAPSSVLTSVLTPELTLYPAPVPKGIRGAHAKPTHASGSCCIRLQPSQSRQDYQKSRRQCPGALFPSRQQRACRAAL